ncbi:hypothetical protein E2C01_043866 [Portunus trituberculatus]|uniref:Uncharacterized protein n=1 Tax=Portunus trituberculatus TaxID=210409 RepID=A0A5B7FXI4_PORTR|nr:hypothetical protein [Portunus trituberculatus]
MAADEFCHIAGIGTEQRVAQTKWLKGTLTLCSDRFRERSDVPGEPRGLLCSHQGAVKFEFKSPSVHSVAVATLPPKESSILLNLDNSDPDNMDFAISQTQTEPGTKVRGKLPALFFFFFHFLLFHHLTLKI